MVISYTAKRYRDMNAVVTSSVGPLTTDSMHGIVLAIEAYVYLSVGWTNIHSLFHRYSTDHKKCYSSLKYSYLSHW